MDVPHRAGPEPTLPVAFSVVEPILRTIDFRIAEISQLLRLEIEQRERFTQRQDESPFARSASAVTGSGKSNVFVTAVAGWKRWIF